MVHTFHSFIQTISRTGSARSGVLSRPHTSLSTNKLDVIEDASNGDELNDDGYDGFHLGNCGPIIGSAFKFEILL